MVSGPDLSAAYVVSSRSRGHTRHRAAPGSAVALSGSAVSTVAPSVNGRRAKPAPAPRSVAHRPSSGAAQTEQADHDTADSSQLTRSTRGDTRRDPEDTDANAAN